MSTSPTQAVPGSANTAAKNHGRQHKYKYKEKKEEEIEKKETKYRVLGGKGSGFGTLLQTPPVQPSPEVAREMQAKHPAASQSFDFSRLRPVHASAVPLKAPRP